MKSKFNFKHIFLMLISVFFMGVSVALLELTSFGPDPFSAMNYSISNCLHLAFGTWQLILNVVLIIFLLITRRSLLGPGTIGNMVIVGYSADLTTYLIDRFVTLDYSLLSVRILIAIPACILFLISAALYMNSETGTSPYDALSFFIFDKIKKINSKAAFFWVRIIYDATVTLIAVLFGLLGSSMSVGPITIVMIVALGPAVDFVGRLLKKREKQN